MTDVPTGNGKFTELERVSYAHANLRLRTRYGMEITINEWYRLGQMFRRGQVNDARKNHIGDLEGWVLVNDVAVCCYYSNRHGCVKTFYAPPPPMPTVAAVTAKVLKKKKKEPSPPPPPPPPKKETPPPAPKQAPAVVVRKITLNQPYVPRDVDWAAVEKNALIDPPTCEFKGFDMVDAEPEPKGSPYRKDLKWFKGTLHKLLTQEPDRDLVWSVLSAMAALPESARPGTDPEQANNFINKRLRGPYRDRGRVWEDGGGI